MGEMSSATSLLFATIFFVTYSFLMCCSGEEVNATFGCVQTERNALLKLKASFIDPTSRLLSWDTHIDCCKWAGVECDGLGGRHVVGLDLRKNTLFSKIIDSSILELERLTYMDLSGNDFSGSPIPTFLGLMVQLQYLNLSNANLNGVVSHHLSNLSRLSVLDISSNDYTALLVVEDFMWVSRLSSLRYVDMSGVNLNCTTSFLTVLNMLPYIEVVHLSGSKLENRNLGHDWVNTSTSNIQVLDLSGNSLDGELPYFLENMTSLTELDLSMNYYDSCNEVNLDRLTNLVRLDLSYNSLNCNVDFITEVIHNNCHMESLDLGFNSFSGDISTLFLVNLPRCPDHQLATLHLFLNNFYGQLPRQFGAFKKLKRLNLRGNGIRGHMPASIGNISTMTNLNLAYNRLSGSIPSAIGNLRALQELYLTGNRLSGPLPSSIGNLRALWNLDLSYNQLSGAIPPSLGNLSNLNMNLDISNNYFEGSIPDSLCKRKHFNLIDLSRNHLSGNLPDCWWKLGSVVLLSWNELSGGIPNSMGESCPLQYLSLSNNRFSGELPSALGDCSRLVDLDISRNYLSGNVPRLNMLVYLALSSNEFSGEIPNSFGEAHSLRWLQLSNNKFAGELPSTLSNCTHLRVLDIGENEISGELPQWIGDNMPHLKVLRACNNEFFGTIPSYLCRLSSLQILDLGNNHFTGKVPRCFGNFSGMVMNNSTDMSFMGGISGSSSLKQVIKGKEMEYFDMLNFVVNMDLSNNNLTGEIPSELTRFAALIGFNLSHNNFRGHIPRRIGNMKLLESLDLSYNSLIGEIPGSLSDLKFLSHLNLSRNKLTGRIPSGSQLQTLIDPSIYDGNPELCGAPLQKKCQGDGASNAPNAVSLEAGDGEVKVDTVWFVGVVISGFATGFWGVIGVLVFKISWRSVYFQYADEKIAKLFGR